MTKIHLACCMTLWLIHFNCNAMFYHVNKTHFVYTVFSGQLGYSQAFAITESTSMNILNETSNKPPQEILLCTMS